MTDQPSHGDILERLGELRGQVNTLIVLVGQKREDLNALFARVGIVEQKAATREEMADVERRIGGIEREVAKWAGICLAASVAFPFFVPYLKGGIQNLERPTAADVKKP